MTEPLKYLHQIRCALQQGYEVNVDLGHVIGKKGKPLSAKRGKNQKYPTTPLVIYEGGIRFVMSVPLHKIIAFAKFGDAAFASGIHVRHLDGNPDNNRGENLQLGSSSENELDKAPDVRRRAAVAARAAQGLRPRNAKLTDAMVAEIREILDLNRDASGKVRTGIIGQISVQYQISRSSIFTLAKRETYAP